MFQTPSTTHLCISDVLNCPPPPRLERSSVSSHFHINNVASMFAPLPFDCYGRKSSLFTSRRVLKPRSVFGTQESAFARLNVALIQEDEEVNERPRLLNHTLNCQSMVRPPILLQRHPVLNHLSLSIHRRQMIILLTRQKCHHDVAVWNKFKTGSVFRIVIVPLEYWIWRIVVR
jgi:hypothetical protein